MPTIDTILQDNPARLTRRLAQLMHGTGSSSQPSLQAGSSSLPPLRADSSSQPAMVARSPRRTSPRKLTPKKKPRNKISYMT
uniref:Uncharacterized protein n=1 Tax=Oryza punctata TaxID=4537 RepID=A0A0E0LY72_ORYPU